MRMTTTTKTSDYYTGSVQRDLDKAQQTGATKELPTEYWIQLEQCKAQQASALAQQTMVEAIKELVEAVKSLNDTISVQKITQTYKDNDE